MRKRLLLICCACGLLALAACGERVQTATPRKADQKAWQGADNPYALNSWKAGDKTSWDEQIRTRAQTQNEYNRVH
jgi:ABC-type oligopeptide transport system substrate-binding subunit